MGFIKVRCPSCKNEQVIFDKPSSIVKCVICGEILARPTGGKGKVAGQVIEVLE